MGIIHVNYEVASTSYTIGQVLRKLSDKPILAFDTEVRSIYSNKEIKEAKELLKDTINMNRDLINELKLIAGSSGLSYPKITKVTHFIFSYEQSNSYILIPNSPQEEIRIWNWLANYTGKTLVWNSLFDMKIMYERIQKLPIDLEDPMLMLRTLINDVDSWKCRTGLKEFVGSYYDPKWSLMEDYTNENYKDKTFLQYCATDTSALLLAYELICNESDYDGVTSNTRPWMLLGTLPAPKDFDPSEEEALYFYKHFVKPLIPDMINLMYNGLVMDEQNIIELDKTIVNVLSNVKITLDNNPLMQEFQALQYKKNYKALEKEQRSKFRTLDYYLKPYKANDVIHRTYLVNEVLLMEGLQSDTRTKWTVNDLKKYNKINHIAIFDSIIDKSIDPNHPIIQVAMEKLAKEKLNIYNKSKLVKLETATKEDLAPPFNPGSSKQKAEFFAWLGVAPTKLSKETGEASWGREQVEEQLRLAEDNNIKEILQSFVDYSYSAIIKNNFLESFSRYTIDGILHGGVKLWGTKTFRPTGQNPNFLQLPSSGSIYAKPLKKCIVHKPGYLIWTIDYDQLEDRILANLTQDEGKCNIFLKNLDSHCYNALGYFSEEIAKYMPLTGDLITDTLEFKHRVEEGDKALKAIRQNGKRVTFGISYGAYPPKISDSIKCPIEQATEIFNNYHNKLYPGITKLREEIILPQAKKNGYVHMGLGARLYSDDIDTNARTIWNSVSQFWSILTLIAMNEFNYRLKEVPYSIYTNATIYDALYGQIEATPEAIKWLNDTLPSIMKKDFLEEVKVPNNAAIEIGTSWADLHELPNNASLEQIEQILKEM